MAGAVRCGGFGRCDDLLYRCWLACGAAQAPQGSPAPCPDMCTTRPPPLRLHRSRDSQLLHHWIWGSLPQPMEHEGCDRGAGLGQGALQPIWNDRDRSYQLKTAPRAAICTQRPIRAKESQIHVPRCSLPWRALALLRCPSHRPAPLQWGSARVSGASTPGSKSVPTLASAAAHTMAAASSPSRRCGSLLGCRRSLPALHSPPGLTRLPDAPPLPLQAGAGRHETE